MNIWLWPNGWNIQRMKGLFPKRLKLTELSTFLWTFFTSKCYTASLLILYGSHMFICKWWTWINFLGKVFPVIYYQLSWIPLSQHTSILVSNPLDYDMVGFNPNLTGCLLTDIHVKQSCMHFPPWLWGFHKPYSKQYVLIWSASLSSVYKNNKTTRPCCLWAIGQTHIANVTFVKS